MKRPASRSPLPLTQQIPHPPAQVLLGQQNPAMGPDWFLAKQRQPPLEPGAARGDRCPCPGQARADHHEALCLTHYDRLPRQGWRRLMSGLSTW
ncbi:MAG: hypothetical protein ACRDP7_24005 [Trebonia sp.]